MSTPVCQLLEAIWAAAAQNVSCHRQSVSPCRPCSKHAIVVADKKLGNSCTIHETIRVKSAAWDDNGALLLS
jgi:hypothetical protein